MTGEFPQDATDLDIDVTVIGAGRARLFRACPTGPFLVRPGPSIAGATPHSRFHLLTGPGTGYREAGRGARRRFRP